MSTRRLAAGALAALFIATGGGAVAGALADPGRTDWMTGAVLAPLEPVLPGIPDNAPVPSQAGLTAAISGLLEDGDLGPGSRVGATVVDVVTGQTLFERNGTNPLRPASTVKLLTGAAVLHTRGPGYQIVTRAVAGPDPGSVVIIGGGDPTLAAGSNATYPGAARLDKLAEQVKAALGGTSPTRVILDTSVFTGSVTGPGWFDEDLANGVTSRITALMTDGGRVNPARTDQHAPRHSEPDMVAARAFAAALGLPASAVSRGSATADARELGRVVSPPIARLVEMMLAESDNVIADMLARQVAIATNRPASFQGAAEATRAVLGELGVPTAGISLVDGSGLSDDNQVITARLADVVASAASGRHPELRALISGLPVAGYSGTLFDRFLSSSTGGAAAGIVRAKTGTLSTVSSLAGIVVDRDGRLLAFAIVADSRDRLGETEAETAIDRVAAALAGCGC